MLLLVPIILIIIILYTVDALYFTDTKPKQIQEPKVISKDANKSTQNYLDKYLKK